ncbi:PREDICTED: 4-coumarate--CoA ligase 1-like [Dufourea novaeangliae]|uniref:4-coumarate--CoA ligase 1-like n=1 Tax=Dufourea novaeangliae TaxID=178035 RepID=UPI0007679634|nr:PREDICTED: 4-coumarate--CoA ligase 1-like [Dufourea novaeangliae]
MKILNNIIHGQPAAYLPNISLQEKLLDVFRNNLDHTVLVDIDTRKSYTNRYLLEASVKLAHALKTYGINAQDRVVITSENHPNYMVVMCAVFNAGAVFNPLNPTYTEREYKHMLEICEPRVIFVSRKTEAIIAKIVSTLSWKVILIHLDNEPYDNNIPTIKKLLEVHNDAVNPYTFVPTPIGDSSKVAAVILCSSGTTGFPKGVMLSHRNLLLFTNAFSIPDMMDCRQGDRIINYLPQFHGYSFGLMLIGMIFTGTIYMMRTFNLETLLQSIQTYKITHLPMVPPILVLIAKHPIVSKYDLSSVKEVLCGAAPLPIDIANEIMRHFKVKSIRNGYGMTELSIVTNFSIRNSNKNDGNVGPPVPGILSKIVNPDTGETLGPGQEGEVCFKTEQTMLGYFRNPKTTAETIDKDQWLHTGDLGYYNKDGLLYISGRFKELIKYKGYQVSPSEIEMMIQSHPDVKDAAVIGKPDEASGELPMALVVRQPGSKISPEDIMAFAKQNLSPHKWLRGGVKFVDAIPKTPSGKILRRELHNMISKL